MKVLGIETSCDETAVAIINEKREVLSHIVLSQIDIHKEFGGVVPEVAARNHLDVIDKVIVKTLEKGGLTFDDIDIISATSGPGLIGGVMVGMMTAKTLASVLKKPFVAVNHLEGHSLICRLTNNVEFPFLLFLLSGGHCQILFVSGVGQYEKIGETIDDALGEAFDKVGQLMGLEYPAGPKIEKIAKDGDENRFKFPKPLISRSGKKKNEAHKYSFSFSGLKTAVRREIEKLVGEEYRFGETYKKLSKQDIADICASFQKTAVDILANRFKNVVRLLEERKVWKINSSKKGDSQDKSDLYLLEKKGSPKDWKKSKESQRFIKSNPTSNSPLEGESRKQAYKGEANSVGGYKHLYSKETLQNAKELREKTTDAEGLLWHYLRNKQLGFKFRRQQPIDKYIVDFVCFEKKLIIELDGGQHNKDKNIQYDNERSEYLKNQGFNIIRVCNNEMFTNTDGVLNAIWNFLHKGILPLTESASDSVLASSTLPQGESEFIMTSQIKPTLVISGGVAANQYIKQNMLKVCKKYNYNLITPPVKLCTDNGVMIALAGLERAELGLFDELDFNPKARWDLTILTNKEE
jgi:N6-L-threonylcarbamoyladenine synthase